MRIRIRIRILIITLIMIMVRINGWMMRVIGSWISIRACLRVRIRMIKSVIILLIV